MAYAVADDVIARAGRFAGLFTVAGRRPNLADLDELLATVSAIIDTEIRAHGYDPATLDAPLVESLRDVAAWAVLVRALPEASPGDSATEDTVARGLAFLEASGFASLATGSNLLELAGAIQALEAGAGGGGVGTSAGSFWDDLPEDALLGFPFRRGDVTLVNGALPADWVDAEAAGPTFTRGQSL